MQGLDGLYETYTAFQWLGAALIALCATVLLAGGIMLVGDVLTAIFGKR